MATPDNSSKNQGTLVDTWGMYDRMFYPRGFALEHDPSSGHEPVQGSTPGENLAMYIVKRYILPDRDNPFPVAKVKHTIRKNGGQGRIPAEFGLSYMTHTDAKRVRKYNEQLNNDELLYKYEQSVEELPVTLPLNIVRFDVFGDQTKNSYSERQVIIKLTAESEDTFQSDRAVLLGKLGIRGAIGGARAPHISLFRTYDISAARALVSELQDLININDTLILGSATPVPIREQYIC